MPTSNSPRKLTVVRALCGLTKTTKLRGMVLDDVEMEVRGTFGAARRFAEGGNAVVYAIGRKEKYVLKIQYDESSPARAQAVDWKEYRFMRDLSKLRIPSVIEFRVARDPSGVMLEVMPMALGTLRTWVRSHGREGAESLCRQAAIGLKALHCVVVHGDLTPDNLMIFDGHVLRYADFGASCRSDGGRGPEPSACALPYVPPEVLAAATSRSQKGAGHWDPGGLPGDVWALGLVAFYVQNHVDLVRFRSGDLLTAVVALEKQQAAWATALAQAGSGELSERIFRKAATPMEVRPTAAIVCAALGLAD